MPDEPEDVVADMQAGESVESPEVPEEPEPEALIEVGTPLALDVGQALAMSNALEAFKFFNHAVARSAIGATVREVVVEIHGQPWCYLRVNAEGTAYVEPVGSVIGPPTGPVG